MVEQHESLTEEQVREKRREEASHQMEAFVKKIVGQTLGPIEETLKILENASNALGELFRKLDNQVEQLTLWQSGHELAKGFPPTEMPDNETEAVVKIPERSIRRRMNRSISTKGIVQYDGTVETTGLSREEFKDEQAFMDDLQNELQPDYEFFVKALASEFNKNEYDATAVETVVAESPEEEPTKRRPGRPAKGT